jgi:hypothetical protein
MANVHPWFADQAIQDAAGWTADFFATTNVAAANALSNKVCFCHISRRSWLISGGFSAHDVHCRDRVANGVFI